MPDVQTKHIDQEIKTQKQLTGELNLNNLYIVADIIITSYDQDSTSQQFIQDTLVVNHWFSLQLDPFQIQKLAASVPQSANAKDYEKEKLLEIYSFLWYKLTQENQDSDLATIQELVKQKEEADARLAEKEIQLSASERFIQQAKSRTLRLGVKNVLRSEVEHAVPATPDQRDPRLEEAVAKAVEGIPIASVEDRRSFIEKAKTLSVHAVTASPTDRAQDVERLMALVDNIDPQIIPAGLRKSISAYIPQPVPLAAPEITGEIVSLIALYPNDSQKAQAAITQYLTQSTASHLTTSEATELAKLYVTAQSSDQIARISNQAQVVHLYTQQQQAESSQATTALAHLSPIVSPSTTPDTLLSEVKSIFPQSDPKELSQLTQDLITSQTVADTAIHSAKSQNDLGYILSSLNPQTIISSVLSPDPLLTQVALQSKVALLTRTPSTELATNLLTSLGFENRVVTQAVPQIISVFSPQASSEVKAARPHVLEFLISTPKQVRTDLTEAAIAKLHSDLVTQISQTFPTKSAEAQVLTSLSPIIARGFSGSPESIQYTLASTVRLYTYLGAGNTSQAAIATLSPLVDTIRFSNPNINRLVSATSTILESYTGLTPGQLGALTNQLTLFHLVTPHATQEQFQAYFDRHIVHKLDALGFTDSARAQKLFSDLHTHFGTNPLTFTPDQRLTASLVTRFTKAGLTPEQARIIAPTLMNSAKLSFYFSGFATPGRNLNETRAYQASAFAETFKVSLASLADTHPILRELQIAGNFKRLGSAQLFNDLHAVLGNPSSLNEAFLVKIQSPVVYSFTQYLSGFVPEPIRPVLTNAAKVLLGSTFLQSNFAKTTGLRNLAVVLASGPTKFRIFGMFSRFNPNRPLQSIRVINRYWGMYDPRIQIGKKFFAKTGLNTLGTAAKVAWTKFAKTAAGKAIVTVGTKIAANTAVQAVLQTLGSFAPVIGNVIAFVAGWIIGDVIAKLIDVAVRFIRWLKDDVLPGLTFALLSLGAYLFGLPALPSLLIGTAGAAVAGGIQSAIGGKTIGFSSETASRAAGKFNYVVSSIATAAVGSTLSGAIAAVIAIPIVVAFIVFIITSSALVVPPTVYNTGSGVGFQNASSCPLANGQISSWSYDLSRQESQGSGNRAHGANGYWRDVWGNNTQRYCTYHLPADDVTCAPLTGPTNYCYIHPNCTTGGNQRNPFYGYAIDITSSDRTVSLPQINGQSATWTYDGNPFCGIDGCAHGFSTNAPDGNTYRLLFIHMVQAIEPPPPISGYISGVPIGQLFDQGGNTHLHLEVQLNNEYVKPENYFCSTGSPAPTGSVVPPLDSDCSTTATGNPLNLGSVQLLPPTSRSGYCIIPKYIVIHWSGAWNGVQGTFSTFVANQNSCQFAIDESTTLQMLNLWDRRVEMVKNCANQRNTDSINIEMSGTCFSMMPGFSTCDEPSEVRLPPESEIARTVNLTCSLKSQYGISTNNIIGHYQIISTKADPGREFLENVFLPRVRSACP